MYYRILKYKLPKLKKVYTYNDVFEELDNWICYNDLPLKGKRYSLKICLNWLNDKNSLIKDNDMIFADVGSLTKDIASKYLNTFDFIEYILKMKQNQKNS
jgi:hypothetical protein